MTCRYLSAAALTVLFLLALAFPAPSLSQDAIVVTRAAEGLYLLTGAVGNVAFLVTEEGVLVVDSGTRPSHGDSIIARIAGLTDRPVRYLIYTHYHMDHVGGAFRFPEDVTVISHEDLPGNMRKFNEPRLREMVEKTYPERVREAEARLDSLPHPGNRASLRLP